MIYFKQQHCKNGRGEREADFELRVEENCGVDASSAYVSVNDFLFEGDEDANGRKFGLVCV